MTDRAYYPQRPTDPDTDATLRTVTDASSTKRPMASENKSTSGTQQIAKDDCWGGRQPLNSERTGVDRHKTLVGNDTYRCHRHDRCRFIGFLCA